MKKILLLSIILGLFLVGHSQNDKTKVPIAKVQGLTTVLAAKANVADTLSLSEILYTKPEVEALLAAQMTTMRSFVTPPALLTTDTYTRGWYRFDDLSLISKDGSNLVASWGNGYGTASALIMATQGAKPLWTSDGILFDGVGQHMATTSFTYAQPEFIYMVVKAVTWTADDLFFDGSAMFTGFVAQKTATPNISAYAGAYSGESTAFTVGAWHILRVHFNGASSKLIIDNGTPITGNFGASNMGLLRLGCKANLDNFSNIQVKEIILRQNADAAATESLIYNYLKNKYGL